MIFINKYFFVVINQTNKHKAKIYDHCMYTKVSSLKNKNFFVLLSMKMINLTLNELKLIAQIRNINEYESKSKEKLIKALSERKPETPETKPKTKPKQILKSETP